MKKIGLIKLVLGLTLAASGAFAVGSAVSNKKAEPVEAATLSSYSKIYRFTAPANNWGDTCYVHIWGSSTTSNNTTWPGTNISSCYSYNESSRKVFVFATNVTDYSKIIFHNNSGWQTNDITIGSNTAWYLDSGNDASAWTPTNQTYYVYDYDNKFGGNAKCYAWQSGGSLINAAYPGVSMTKVANSSGNLYSISLDPAFDEFKVGIGDSANTGDQWINQKHGQCFCWWETSTGTWSNDLDWVKAHDWVENTMHIRDIPTSNNNDTNACRGNNGYYTKAKNAYNSFSASIKSKAKDTDHFSSATARFSAWAAANGETATWNGSNVSINGARASLLSSTNIENTNTVAIIVIISLVSVTAIGGFFFIRKRREN